MLSPLFRGRYSRFLATTAIGLAACLASLSAPAQAQTFDVVADFSSASNPNGPYSYGFRSTAVSAAFSLFNGSVTTYAGVGVTGFGQNNGIPFVLENNSGVTAAYATVLHPVDMLNLHPGTGGGDQYSVTRFTVTAGTLFATLTGSFQGIDTGGTTTDVHVVVNGVSVFSSAVVGFGNTQSFNIVDLPVVAGNVIDFVVGSNGNGFGNDSTGLQATITLSEVRGSAAPEPSALALLLPVLTMAVSARRKRRC
jgi:hypothetical protein